MFEVEWDEGCFGDRADAGGTGADVLECGEGSLEQGVGPFGQAVHAADDRVVRALRLGQLLTSGFLCGWRMAGEGLT